MKRFLLHGSAAAALSALACLLYNSIYKTAFYVDFSSVIDAGTIVGACTFSCTLIALGYFVCFKWKGNKLTGIYNLLVLILTFASSIGALTFRLPLDVASPELFIGLAIPMHYFPVLAFFSIAPFFKPETEQLL